MNCTHHFDRLGTHLCMSCGKWYCNACMEPAQFPPICIYCNRSLAPFNPVRLVTHITRLVKGAIKLGLSIVSLVLLGGALFFRHPFLYIPAICALVITGAVFRAFRSPSVKEKPSVSKAASKHITMEQVNTLLRISDNRITAKRLSSATNTSLEVAEKYLHDLVVEGKLEVQAGEQELIYTKGPE